MTQSRKDDRTRRSIAQTATRAGVGAVIFGFAIYVVVLVAEYKYMEYNYNRAVGQIDDVRKAMKFFTEKNAALDDLGPGYVRLEIFNEPNFENYSVYKYTLPTGGYFHIIYDENKQVWDRAPTGFTDFF